MNFLSPPPHGRHGVNATLITQQQRLFDDVDAKVSKQNLLSCNKSEILTSSVFYHSLSFLEDSEPGIPTVHEEQKVVQKLFGHEDGKNEPFHIEISRH